MAITMNSFADVQKYLAQFTTSAGVTPQQAPHGTFWSNLSYQDFTQGNVPNVGDIKILEVGNSKNSNIIQALQGVGPLFNPNGSIGPMPQPSPPYDSATPSQSDIITALAAWIDASCPEGDTAGAAEGEMEAVDQSAPDTATY